MLDTCHVVFAVLEVDVVATTGSKLISKVIADYLKHIIDSLKPIIYIKTGRNVNEMSMYK